MCTQNKQSRTDNIINTNERVTHSAESWFPVGTRKMANRIAALKYDGADINEDE